MDAKFFSQPFAVSGDKVTIPEDAQPSGAVSFAQGFTFDYTRELGVDPLAKAIPRDVTNELFYLVTQALGQIQREGVAEFIAPADNDGAAFPYARGALVRYGTPKRTFVSRVDANVALPTDATKWAPLVFEVATTDQVEAGEDDATIVTPLKLAEALDAIVVSVPDASETVKGKARIATAVEAVTADDTLIMTPAKVAVAVPTATTTTAGRLRRATSAEISAFSAVAAALTPDLAKPLFDTKANTENPIFTGDAFTTGSETLRAPTNVADASYYFRDDTNKRRGLVGWARSTDAIRIARYNAAGTAIESQLSMAATTLQYTGTVQITGAVQASLGFQNTSSRTVKDIDGPLPYGLAEILRIETVIGSYRLDFAPNDNGRKRLFLIAEQVREVLREAVFEHEDSPTSIDFAQVIAVVIQAIKDEHRERVAAADTMNERLTALEARLARAGIPS